MNGLTTKRSRYQLVPVRTATGALDRRGLGGSAGRTSAGDFGCATGALGPCGPGLPLRRDHRPPGPAPQRRSDPRARAPSRAADRRLGADRAGVFVSLLLDPGPGCRCPPVRPRRHIELDRHDGITPGCHGSIERPAVFHRIRRIELKYNGHDQQLARRAAELVRSENFVDQCVITSLEQAGLRQVRSLAPDIRIGQIVTVSLGDIKQLDVDLLSMQSSLATPRQIRANRAAGLKTHVWTLNKRDGMQRMIERGVDNIITDEPALLRALIEERKALSDGEILLLALSSRLQE